MKKVLIALDYSPTAQKVAEVGYKLAKSMGAHVTLLHAISDPFFYYTSGYSPIMGFTGFADMGPMQLDSVGGLKKASQAYLDKTIKHLGDPTIETIVKEGDYADTILTIAKLINADIVVIGTHSRRWLDEIMMGSVTEKVLHQSKIPLFIIPTKKPKGQ